MANGFSNLNNLKLDDSLGLQFTGRSSEPTDSELASGRLYWDSVALALKIYNGSSWTTLGSGGGGGTPSWETLYLNDSSFSITSGTWVISQSSAAAIVTFNKTNVGAGTVVEITNAGTGNDIGNTVASWYIKRSGATGILELGSGGSINVTDGALSIGKTGTATTLLGTATIAEGWTVTSGNNVITSGNLTLSAGNAVLTLGNLTLTNGLTSLSSTSNAAASVSVINNTVTTYGSAAASGVFEVSSTSLTSGTLVHLELTEGTLNGGYYLRAWDVTAGGAVFSIGEDGVVVMAGTAGSNSFTMTAGDVVLSDGSITLVDADNAASFSLTNNTATTIGAAASGGVVTLISTSLTTGALLNLELTEGTLNGGWYLRAWDATGAAAVFSIGEDGVVVMAGTAGSNSFTMTAGDAVLSDGSLTITDADNAVSFALTNNTASTANVATISGTGLTDGFALSITGGGANMSASGYVIAANMGAATVGTGVGIFSTGVYVGSTGLLSVTANSATTGVIAAITANGLTTGTALSVTSSGTIVTTGELVSFVANSATTSTGVIRVSATGLTDGTALSVTGGGANMTASGFVAAFLMGAATAGTGLAVSTTGVYTGTTGVFSVTANSATTGGVAVINATGLTSGVALQISATEATLTTGKYIQCYDGAAADFTVGKYGATVIAGNASTTVFTITAGNAVITAGNATLTLGNIILTEGTIITTPQAIVNANTAISVTHGVTTIANNAGSTHTMADGVAGQRKTIVCTVYAADAVITPSNLANGTTITLNAVGDAVDMIFLGTEWWVVNLFGTAALA